MVTVTSNSWMHEKDVIRMIQTYRSLVASVFHLDAKHVHPSNFFRPTMEEPRSLPGWASSFDDLLDRRVLSLLIDGRKIVGYLRSYDQFANILIDEA